MNNIFGVRVMEEYIHMCSDGVRQGWHERNGGNLTYRMRGEEVPSAGRISGRSRAGGFPWACRRTT